MLLTTGLSTSRSTKRTLSIPEMGEGEPITVAGPTFLGVDVPVLQNGNSLATNNNLDQDHRMNTAHSMGAPPVSIPGVHEPISKGTQTKFDEQGAELEPDARVWKTYMKEADRFDIEKVTEWNKSLDVILIVAALFSAISTAFVIEASKKLQKDPVEKSSQSLELISQALYTIAHGGKLTLATSEQTDFKPSPSVRWVTSLWYTSLSLSVAASFIAMIAKEWCASFLSGRTNDLRTQSQKRQRRWDRLTWWRMPMVLAILPTFIHLALVLFGVGLCVYLKDINCDATWPVVVILAVAFGAYFVSNILPLWDDYCPYQTALFQLVRTESRKDTLGEADRMEHNDVTPRALCWLIENCEDPRSADTALQAIAGVDSEMDVEPLRQCNASMMIYRRLTNGNVFPKTQELLFSLYERALAVLQSPMGHAVGGQNQVIHVKELKKMVVQLQVSTKEHLLRELTNPKSLVTQENLLALSVGSNASSRSLRSLNHIHRNQLLETLDSAVGLLEKHGNAGFLLHPAALRSLVIGIAMIVSCSFVHIDPCMVVPHMLRVSRITKLGTELRGLILATFSISQNKYYPGWRFPTPLGSVARATRAIEFVQDWERMLTESRPTEAGILYKLGLSEILMDSEKYRLVDRDFEDISSTFESIGDHNVCVDIKTFPPTFLFSDHLMATLGRKLSRAEAQDYALRSEASVQAYLQTLDYAYKRIDPPAPAPEVYMFVIESICRFSDLDMLIQAGPLMSRFPLLDFTDELVIWVSNRNIISLLVNSLDTDNGNLRIFAMAQLCWVLKLILPVVPQLDAKWKKGLTSELQGRDLVGLLRRLELVREAFVHQLAVICNQPASSSFQSRVLSHVKRVVQASIATPSTPPLAV